MPKRKPPQEIEDLVDFYRCWPELRGEMLKLQNTTHLTAEQAPILEWMIFVVDRVGPADLDP